MDPPPSTSHSRSPGPPAAAAATAITDVDVDALARCADHLTLQEVSNMAMSCRFLRRVAYSDSVWHRLYREKWPRQASASFATGVRRAYLDRLSVLQQFKFVDPLVIDYLTEATCNAILLEKNNVVLAQTFSPQCNFFVPR